MRVTTVDDRCRLFFRLFFDDFEIFDFSEKGYWARCFGKRFGSSGGFREGFLGHPGGSRRPLGGFWGSPGGSGGRLGRVLVSPSSPSGLVTTPTCLPSTLHLRPQTSLNFTSFYFSFFAPSWLPLGLPFGAFLAPKLAQVRPKLPLDTLLFRKH